ncbi:hypothetical protein V8E51_010329 [Hyaloscypha variabilis]
MSAPTSLLQFETISACAALSILGVVWCVDLTRVIAIGTVLVFADLGGETAVAEEIGAFGKLFEAFVGGGGRDTGDKGGESGEGYGEEKLWRAN